jgi:hypothetical protein
MHIARTGKLVASCPVSFTAHSNREHKAGDFQLCDLNPVACFDSMKTDKFKLGSPDSRFPLCMSRFPGNTQPVFQSSFDPAKGVIFKPAGEKSIPIPSPSSIEW